MAEQHSLFRGKLRLYKRGEGKHWQCSTYLKGKNHRISTKEDSLAHAKEYAEDWYLELRGKSRAGQLESRIGKTFRLAVDQFLLEYEAITEGERSPAYVESFSMKLRVHLLPFFGDKLLTEITSGLVQEYRAHRATSRKDSRPANRSSPHAALSTKRPSFCAMCLRPPSGTAGLSTFPTCHRPTNRPARFPIVHGSRPQNTSDSMKQRAAGEEPQAPTPPRGLRKDARFCASHGQHQLAP